MRQEQRRRREGLGRAQIERDKPGRERSGMHKAKGEGGTGARSVGE